MDAVKCKQDVFRQIKLIFRLIKVLGEDKMAELKALRESGTPIKDIAEKTTKWISELTDENAKKSAQEHGTLCRKAFNLQ
jgi:hypothetical protein